MGQKGTGRRLSDQERMEIIAKLEGDKPRATAAECARQYGVSSAAITKLMKMKDKIKQRFQKNNTFSQQRKRGGTERHSAFEDELFQWIGIQQQLQQQDHTLPPLTSTRVQEKAQELLKAHDLGSFRASKGWYYRFCRRYGLSRSSLGPDDSDQKDREIDVSVDPSDSESDSSQDATMSANGAVKTEKVVVGKKRKEGSSLSSTKDTKKLRLPFPNGWAGVESLQDTLARAAVALDHPEARSYLGEDAAGEMLRSIQQSIGVVQCIRLKKSVTESEPTTAEAAVAAAEVSSQATDSDVGPPHENVVPVVATVAVASVAEPRMDDVVA